MDPADPVAVLERWLDHGAGYRILELVPDHAVLQLLTCHGEPVERLESRDPKLIEFVKQRSACSPTPATTTSCYATSGSCSAR